MVCRDDPLTWCGTTASNSATGRPAASGIFTGPDGTKESVRVGGRLKVNNPQVLHTAALNGDGIEFDPTFIVGPDIAAGRLLPLLPDYTPTETDLSVVYPSGRQLSAKVRSFVDFMATRFAGEPQWDRWRVAGGEE